MMRRGFAGIGLAVWCGCLEYSPHAVVLDPSERDLHARALERLAAAPPLGDGLRFAVVGDTQLAFDEARDAIEHLNARDDLAFVVQLGDFTHVGLLPEYRKMNAIFARLRVPYFVVVGIHDLLGNGDEIYARMFGPVDFVFTVGRIRFVLFDSNSREAGFGAGVPDLAWLAAQLAPDGQHDRVVLLSHVAPGTADFDPALGALQFTYTFGDEFFLRPPGRYPSDYYDFPTALHAGIAVAGGVSRLTGGALREVGVYWELVALDTMLLSWFRNPSALGPQDVFSLALGLRFAF